MSSATAVETPAGTFRFSFEATPVGVMVTIGGLRLPADDAMKGAALELSPVFEPGKFRTRHFAGDRWKCIPASEGGKWVTESHDDVVTSRFDLTAAQTQGDPPRFSVYRRGAASPVTERLRLRFLLPKAPPVVFLLRLESPQALPPTVAEMLKQYQKLGSAAEVSELHWNRLKFVRVRKNECGDAILAEESFDAASIQTLAFPSHDWRLATAHGWVFAEPIESHREGAIPSDFDFTRIDPKNLTYLGDPYSRELISVDTSPGKATVTFALGDFSGCFGASCGTPVNVRNAIVTFANGALSTRIVRPQGAPEE